MEEEKTTRVSTLKDVEPRMVKNQKKETIQSGSSRRRITKDRHFQGELSRRELNPDGGYKRQKSSGFNLGESESAEVTSRIDRRLPRASHRWAR